MTLPLDHFRAGWAVVAVDDVAYMGQVDQLHTQIVRRASVEYHEVDLRFTAEHMVSGVPDLSAAGDQPTLVDCPVCGGILTADDLDGRMCSRCLARLDDPHVSVYETPVRWDLACSRDACGYTTIGFGVDDIGEPCPECAMALAAIDAIYPHEP